MKFKLTFIFLLFFLIQVSMQAQSDDDALMCFSDYEICLIDAEIAHLVPLNVIEGADSETQYRKFVSATAACGMEYFACRG